MQRLCTLLLVSLLLAGCSGSQTTQAESAGGTADSLIKTCVAGRPHDSLELLSPPARDFLLSRPNATTGCLALLGVRSASELHGTRVVSVHANDLSATAELRSPDGRRTHLELEKVRGVWSVMHPR